jgi:hypothetical protein
MSQTIPNISSYSTTSESRSYTLASWHLRSLLLLSTLSDALQPTPTTLTAVRIPPLSIQREITPITVIGSPIRIQDPDELKRHDPNTLHFCIPPSQIMLTVDHIRVPHSDAREGRHGASLSYRLNSHVELLLIV